VALGDEKLSRSKKELVLSNLSLVIAHRWAVINRDGPFIVGRGEKEPENAFVLKKTGFFYHETRKLSLYAGGGILLSAWPRSDEPATSILS